MKILWRSNVRYLTRTWLITAVSLLSLCVGVASVILVHVLSERIVSQLDSHSDGYQYVVRHDTSQLNESDYFALRRYWRRSVDSTILGMVPVIEGWAEVDDQIVRIVGLDPLADYRLLETNQLNLQANVISLESLMASGIMTARDATARSLKGDVSVPIREMKPGPEQLLSGDLPVVQKLLDRDGELDSIWLRVGERPFSLVNEILPGAISRYPAAIPLFRELFQGVGQNDLVISSMGYWRPFRAFADSIAFNVSVLSALALFVSGFIVYQALYISFKNRQVEAVRLKTLGVSQNQLRRLYLGEAIFIGIAGSFAGVLLSSVLTHFLLVDQIDENLWEAFDNWSITKGVMLGVVSALIAGLSATSTGKSKVQRWLLVLAILLMGIGFFEATGKAGAIGIILGLCITQLVVVTPIFIALLRSLIDRVVVKSLVVRSVFRGAVTRISELRVASGALTIAMAAAIGMGLMVESFRQDLSGMLSQRIPASLFLTGAAVAEAPVLSNISGVKQVREYHRGEGTINSEPVSIVLTQLDVWESNRYGYPGKVRDGIIINEYAKIRYGLTDGDVVLIRVGEMTKFLPIKHVYQDYGEPVAKAIVPVGLFDAVLSDMVLDQYAITLQKEASISQVRNAITKKYRNISIRDHNQIRRMALEVFDRTFLITDYLTMTAIAVAVLGMYGAVLSTEAQRRRHKSLLRTLGVGRKSLFYVAITENTIIGSLAVACAIPLGLAIDMVLCEVLNPRAFGWSIEFGLYAQPILIPCLLGLVASVFASTIPVFTKEKLITNRSSYEL